MRQGNRDNHELPEGRPKLNVDLDQVLVKHYVEDFDSDLTLIGSKWDITLAGSGAIISLADRGGGWVRASVGAAPPGAPGSVKLVTKKPIFVCGTDPMSIFRIIAAFKAGAGPEGNPAMCGPGGVASGVFCGITDDPLTIFGPGSSGLVFDSPGPFDPGVPSPVWHYNVVQNGGVADLFIAAQVSEDFLNPDQIGGSAKAKEGDALPPIGFGGIAAKVNSGPDKFEDPRNPYGEVVGLPSDINPGCEPNSMGTAYYGFILVGIPYPNIFNAYPPICIPPATREIAFDVDLFESKCERIAREVGGAFAC